MDLSHYPFPSRMRIIDRQLQNRLPAPQSLSRMHPSKNSVELRKPQMFENNRVIGVFHLRDPESCVIWSFGRTFPGTGLSKRLAIAETEEQSKHRSRKLERSRESLKKRVYRTQRRHTIILGLLPIHPKRRLQGVAPDQGRLLFTGFDFRPPAILTVRCNASASQFRRPRTSKPSRCSQTRDIIRGRRLSGRRQGHPHDQRF